MKEIEAFTDGACRGNPGPGGWGVVLRHHGREKELCGGDPLTTNNRMEMTAAIRALETLKEPCRVQLYTDSTYLMKGVTEWLPRWIARGWRTADKKAVKNQDLWLELDALTKRHEVSWHWVRGHSGHVENERADALANEGLEKSQREGRRKGA